MPNFILVLATLALVGACSVQTKTPGPGGGDDDDDTPSADAGTPSPNPVPPPPDPTPAPIPDAGTWDAATPTPQDCAAPALIPALGGLANPTAVQRNQPGTQGARKLYVLNGAMDVAARPDLLNVQLWDAMGVFTGPVTPGTFTLTGAELRPADCGVCVAVLGDRDAATARLRTLYFATGGTVTIDSVTPVLKGRVANMTFAQIDPATGAFVPGGCKTSLVAASFEADVVVTDGN